MCDAEPIGCTKLEQIDTIEQWPDGELTDYRIYHIASNMLNATSLGAKVDAGHYITHMWIANAHMQITYVAWVSDVPINLYNQFCRLLGKADFIKYGEPINQPSL